MKQLNNKGHYIMNNPKYTFLLPAYKACFFEEALLSIKNQTYTNFVCIVSDDCSPEDLKSVFDKVCADDPRFSYRRNDQNIGGENLIKHWNMLVEMCDTEFLIMASDDDVYDHNYLEEMDKLTQKYPHLDLYKSRARMINDNRELISEDYNFDEYLSWMQFLTCFDEKMIACLSNYCYKTLPLKYQSGFINFPLAMKSDAATAIWHAQKGIAITLNTLFSFRHSGKNISSLSDFSKYTKILDANLLYVKWYKNKIESQIPSISPLEKRYGYLIKKTNSYHVENYTRDLMLQLPFKGFIQYMREFRMEGYFLGKYTFTLMLFKWLRNHFK